MRRYGPPPLWARPNTFATLVHTVLEQQVSLASAQAAFDRLFFAVRPDYVIEVKPSILAEHDGPMLVVGLQQIHGKLLLLPRRQSDRPDPKRLEQRYADFLRAS